MLLPVEMRWFIPTNSGQGGPGPEWGRWFSSAGQEGEEPPAEIQTLYDHYNTMNTVLDDAERVAAGQKIFDGWPRTRWPSVRFPRARRR